MKIIKTIEMTQKEKDLCETASRKLSTIRGELCSQMKCNGIDCSTQCPISKAVNLITDCGSRLAYIARYGTNKGYDEP
jgi:hypothetical protein